MLSVNIINALLILKAKKERFHGRYGSLFLSVYMHTLMVTDSDVSNE